MIPGAIVSLLLGLGMVAGGAMMVSMIEHRVGAPPAWPSSRFESRMRNEEVNPVLRQELCEYLEASDSIINSLIKTEYAFGRSVRNLGLVPILSGVLMLFAVAERPVPPAPTPPAPAPRG